MAKINFRSGDRAFAFPNKTFIKAFIEKLIKKSIPVVKSHAYDVTMMHDIPKQTNVGIVSNSLNHRRKPGKRSRAFTQRAQA